MEKAEALTPAAKTGRKPAASSHRLKSLRRRLILRKLKPSLKPKEDYSQVREKLLLRPTKEP